MITGTWKRRSGRTITVKARREHGQKAKMSAGWCAARGSSFSFFFFFLFLPGLRRCCSLPSSTCTRSTARWTALSFLSLFWFLFFLLLSLSFLFSLLSFSRCATNQGTSREGMGEGGTFRCESGDPTSSRIDELRKYRRLICVSLHAAVKLDTSHGFLPEGADSMAGDRKCRSSRRIGTFALVGILRILIPAQRVTRRSSRVCSYCSDSDIL